MLTPILSRQRQKRLLDRLADRNFDAIVIGSPQHVYYLTAHFTGWQHLSALVLFADGRSLLYTANAPNKAAAADDVREYEAQAHSTLRDDQPSILGGLVAVELRDRGINEIGIDASVLSSQVGLCFPGIAEAIDSDLFEMRRIKDADELELMRRAMDCCRAMYAHAREIIEPGIPELRVFAELQAVAVRTAGEPLSALLGNDYACGVPGGAARGDKVAEDGQLYILDLGPVVRGYFSDNARTIAVNRKPTDEQYRAHEAILQCIGLVEVNAKPGVKAYHLWKWIDDLIKAAGYPQGLPHHLGHGVGLSPHEHPYLNPDTEWDDELQEGEIFTAEPGIYGPEINGGIRIENQYLVTATGVQRLTDFPVGLV